MTTASGGTVAAVATSPNAVVVGMDARDQLAKPVRRGQFCSDAARPGDRRGLPARPGHRCDETGLWERRSYRCSCAVRQWRRCNDPGRRAATRFVPGRQGPCYDDGAPQEGHRGRPRCAPDAVATTAVSGVAAAAVATTPWAQAAVATIPDAGQQLALSLAARGGGRAQPAARQ